MKVWVAIVLVFVCGTCWPQFVQISGTVTDGSCAYANGSGRVVLVPQNQQFLVNGTNPVQSPIPINGLDSFGKFSIQLTNTSLITPASANPQWEFSFCSQPVNGQQAACFTMTPMSLTTSQDISTQIQAQAAPIQNCASSSLTGSGSTNVVTKWTGTNSLGSTGISEYSSPPIWDSPSGFWQLQADSGAGSNLGGVLNLQSTNGPFSNAAASLLVGSNGIQIDANHISLSSLLLANVTGSTQCLHASTSGVVSGTSSDCIGGAQYTKLRCETGLGDGLNSMTAGTYLQSFCYNDSGVTWTITGIKCFTDNSGTSTLNATNGSNTALLTGAITCSSAFASGTQSGTVTIANGDFVKFTFVADGTSKQSTWVISISQ